MLLSGSGLHRPARAPHPLSLHLDQKASAGTVPIQVTNNTGLKGSKGQIHFTVYGADLAADGSTIVDQWYLEVNKATNKLVKHVIGSGDDNTNVPSFTLKQFPKGIALPKPTSANSPIDNGRIYIGVGGSVVAGIQDSAVTAPTPGDGLNDQTYYDFVEFALQNGSVHGAAA